MFPLMVPNFNIDGESDLVEELVGYWKLDESSGNAIDSGPNGLDLTDVNTVTSATGKVGNARQFTSGSSEYLTRSDEPALRSGNIDFSLCGWSYFDTDAATAQVQVARYGGAAREFAVQHRQTAGVDVIRWIIGNSVDGDTSIESAGDLATGKWIFWHASHRASDSGLRLYVIEEDESFVSGELITGTAAFDPGSEACDFSNGALTVPSQYANGRIDAVGYWHIYHTADQIKRLFNSGAGLEYPFL